MKNKKIISFDSTLHDREQGPGISMNWREKFEVAHPCAQLEGDAIEAGFSVASHCSFASIA